MRAVIEDILKEALGSEYVPGTIEAQAKEEFGHYTTPIAMRLAKEAEMPPRVVAENVKERLESVTPPGLLERVEVAGAGFVNIWISDEAARTAFALVAAVGEKYGRGTALKGKRVMVEYTDPNPFKQFHIGHLMTNMIGESLARLHEAAGAEVLRVNYQGDVGLHVAKSIWGMRKLAAEMPKESASLSEKTAYLGQAYAAGAKASGDEAVKAEIETINKKIYDRSDAEINKLYDKGRQWSLDYFETLYARLGTKFVHYFFESEVGPDGLKIVKEHPEVFRESEGAVIFPGEERGLHNRVFVNKHGLPTYEAKELGLNVRKFKLYHPDLSLVVTGNEINEYFKVLLEAMLLVAPEVAAKTRHIGHGMLRLPSGKMSSRTGDVITAEWLIEEVKKAVAEKLEGREGISDDEKEDIKEKVAMAAIRHSILRQGIGKDIIFDLATSISFQGDSGPYLQYTYARLRRLLAKAKAEAGAKPTHDYDNLSQLTGEHELRLMRKLFQFPDQVARSASELMTNNLTEYLYQLANLANRFYEEEPIIADGNHERRAARLLLADTVSQVIANGLGLLGIEALESI